MAKHDPNRLYPSGDGRFCKRVRGVLYHFGGGGDYDAALREWLKVKDDLLAGRHVRRPHARAVTCTLSNVENAFLNEWGRRVNDGKIRAATFDDYYAALDQFVAAVGAGRDPDDLTPDDFADVRGKWSERLGPWALDRHVQAVRTMFRWASKHRLIPREPFYGDAFGKSTEAEKRAEGRRGLDSHGERVFTPAQVRRLVKESTGQLKAMILLAVNGGMYPIDLARLKVQDVKREGRSWVIDTVRTKTGGVPWKFPLWPETKKAIDTVVAESGTAQDQANADLLFLTVRGNPWHVEHVHRDDAGEIAGVSETHGIGQEFDKLLDRLKLKRHRLGFGALRHTHVTAVGDHGDERAAKRVRGHKIATVEKHYDKIPLERLRAVTDLARRRLLLSASKRGAPRTGTASSQPSGQPAEPHAAPHEPVPAAAVAERP